MISEVYGITAELFSVGLYIGKENSSTAVSSKRRKATF